MKTKPLLIVLLVAVISFVLRTLYLKNGAITFGFDQARDAFEIGQILTGDIKIQGPSTSGVPGFFHGVLYYYLLLPGYLIGNGSPMAAAFWLCALCSLTIYIVYFFLIKITAKVFPAIIGSVLMATSFEFSQYSVWLSNPALGVVFVPLIYLGLFLWIKEKRTVWLGVTGIAWGLAIQSNISLFYHGVPIAIWLLLYKKKYSIKHILLIFISFVIGILSMIVAQLKFGLGLIQGIDHLVLKNQSIGSFDFLKFGSLYVQHMTSIVANNLFPDYPLFALFIFLGIFVWCIVKIKKTKDPSIFILLVLWILAYLPVAAIGGLRTPHIGVGIGVGVVILTVLAIWEMYSRSKILGSILVSLIILANVSKIIGENIKGQTIFAIQADMTLANEIEAINYTYQSTNGGAFSINTVTSPLFINTTWSYLYNWYGKTKYGFLPSWRGRDQIGSLGNNLEKSSNDVGTHYLIIEDPEGIPERYIYWAIGEEESRSKLVEEETFGNIRVQKRLISN